MYSESFCIMQRVTMWETGGRIGLLVADHGPLDMERATEHGPCAVNHKTEKSRWNSSG